MADRYDQFDISCGVELSKKAAATSTVVSNDMGGGINDASIIDSQDS